MSSSILSFTSPSYSALGMRELFLCGDFCTFSSAEFWVFSGCKGGRPGFCTGQITFYCLVWIKTSPDVKRKSARCCSWPSFLITLPFFSLPGIPGQNYRNAWEMQGIKCFWRCYSGCRKFPPLHKRKLVILKRCWFSHRPTNTRVVKFTECFLDFLIFTQWLVSWHFLIEVLLESLGSLSSSLI